MVSDAPRYNPSAGFTLVEILIVVVILGVLAAIVIPQFASASESSRKSAFVAELNEFAKRANVYQATHGEPIEDSSSGVLPAELAGSIPAGDWERGTPVGGVWDAERDGFAGMSSGIGVHFNNGGTSRDDAFMTEIDLMIDDGDLATGGFRKFAADRYYLVLMP